jgi:hypothetical protein
LSANARKYPQTTSNAPNDCKTNKPLAHTKQTPTKTQQQTQNARSTDAKMAREGHGVVLMTQGVKDQRHVQNAGA